MEKRLRFMPLMVIILVFMAGFLLLRVVSLRNQSPWTEQEIKEGCALTPAKGRSNGIDNTLQLGWDSSHHFYAVEGEEGVGIVDARNGRCCVLGITGAWFDGAFQHDTYDLSFHNQYGWATTASLDLRRWEVSTSVSGACFQWMSCRPLDPPQISVLGHCDSAHVYGPAGLD